MRDATVISRVTACAALWCGVHCAVTPVLVLAMPVLVLSESLERNVCALTVMFGAAVLLMSPGGRIPAVMCAFVGGAAVWMASLAGWLAPLPEPLMSASGSLMIAAGLLASARICKVQRCACERRKG